MRKSDSSSSSGNSSTGSSTDDNLEEMEGIFMEDSRVRLVSERFPGALSFETLGMMRRSLLNTAGETGEQFSTNPVAVLYYRQVLARRTSGAQARELLNLATAIDHLLRGRVCHALDVLTQRLKAQESVATGTHWGVAQRMELPVAEQSTLVARSELERAQKENYQESRAKWLAQQSGQRKGDGKNKSKGSKGEKGGWQKEDHREEDKTKGKGKHADKK